MEREDQPADHSDYAATNGHRANRWLLSVWRQFQAIAALPDGWGSNGAPAPDAHKVEAAWGLLLCLCGGVDLPKPYVNPTRNGGVQLEWEAGGPYFELEVVAERAATYLYCDDAAHEQETGSIFEDDSLEPVLAYIRRVDAHR